MRIRDLGGHETNTKAAEHKTVAVAGGAGCQPQG